MNILHIMRCVAPSEMIAFNSVPQLSQCYSRDQTADKTIQNTVDLEKKMFEIELQLSQKRHFENTDVHYR